MVLTSHVHMSPALSRYCTYKQHSHLEIVRAAYGCTAFVVLKIYFYWTNDILIKVTPPGVGAEG